VRIYLPRTILTAEAAGQPLRQPDPGCASGTECILVVEDDDALRAHTTEVLADLGYQVLQASHPAAALRVLDDRRQIDLLFTDIVMPGGMNGRELADEALRRRPALKVLFTSGHSRNAIALPGPFGPHAQTPRVHMIGKPFSIATLASRVRDILDGTAESP
jgi:CheY-like chemotaxis protein